MAATWKGSAIAGSLTKLFAGKGTRRLREDPSPVSSFLTSPTRRAGAVYYSSSLSSSYDKNIDDEVCPAVVPDCIVKAGSDSYWGPHPITGVFGPAGSDSGGSHGLRIALRNDNAPPSVLDQTVWFRSGDDHDYHEPPYY